MIVKYIGQVETTPEAEPNGKLSRIEWFALVGLLISVTSLALNLYRLRHAK